jgi:hypothetical protein
MDYRYLAETKSEFNNFLCGILVPHLYHGIKGMLKYSENVYNQIEIKNKRGAKIENPGIIVIFKKTLDGLASLNNHEIEINHSTHNAQANVGNTFNLNPGKSFSYIFGQDDGRHWIETAGSSNSELRCAKRQYYTTCASLTKVYAPNQEYISGQTPIFPIP